MICLKCFEGETEFYTWPSGWMTLSSIVIKLLWVYDPVHIQMTIVFSLTVFERWATGSFDLHVNRTLVAGYSFFSVVDFSLSWGKIERW